MINVITINRYAVVVDMYIIYLKYVLSLNLNATKSFIILNTIYGRIIKIKANTRIKPR